MDVELGGRHFTRINLDRMTVYVEQYLDRMLSESGLDRVLPADDDTPQMWQLKLHAQLRRSGKACETLAGYLLPLGKTERDWTPELAAEVAKHIGLCDTAADRASVDELVLECALLFFRLRLASYVTFPSSSNDREPAAAPSRPSQIAGP